MEVSNDDYALVLLSSYFVLKGCKSLFSFLEYIFLDTCVDKHSPLVKRFLANIPYDFDLHPMYYMGCKSQQQ